MLTELKLSNFRIFDDEVTVRFRPITVLIGHNNAGKSSIIKFLLMLQQSLDSGGPKLLQPEGAKVTFGEFHNFRNSNTQQQNLSFDLTVTNDFSTGDALRDYLGYQNILYEEHQLRYTTYATIPYENSSGHPLDHGGKLILNSEEILVCNKPSFDDGGTLLDFFDAFPSEQLNQDELQELRAQMNMIKILRQNIRAIEHLQACRSEPSRVMEMSSLPSGSVGQDGRYAISHLKKIFDMKNISDSSYRLILSCMHSVAGIEKIEFEQATESIVRCFATNRVTNAKSYIADFGFGVSQCMPIFVQGAIMSKYSHLMIEQPDAQLHPTAQLELGSFFADLWKERKVGAIIETHSDNLLLRLRRLIATGELSAKDVSVAYFTHDKKNENMPVIRNLDINPDGSIEPGLPAEFFGKNLEEVLKMGVGSSQEA